MEFFRLFLSLILLIIDHCLLSNAESVQFCKSGDTEQINFCMGMTIHHNASSDAYDQYITFTTKRKNGSSRGWTAIGPGNIMADAMMFIIYGDPLSNEDPIISIRTSPNGHHQPELVRQTDAGTADLRVMRASWLRVDGDPDAYEAIVSIICYACGDWPGITLDPLSTSQPWVWAWNPSQQFDVFSYDAHLLMHKHHANTGGWGNFYVNSVSALTTGALPSVPTIRPDVTVVGAAESPLHTSFIAKLVGAVTMPSLHAHGVLMTVSFLVISPLGVVMMRWGSSKSFRYHWIIQVVAGSLALLGLLVGLLLRQRINSTHQIVGIVVTLLLGVQAVLGWRHHVVFVALHKRTWISYAHMYLGRAVMLAGSGNVLAGMILRGYARKYIAGAAVGICVLLSSLSIWLWRARRKQHKHIELANPADYFAIAGDDDDDDEGSSDDNLATEKQSRKSDI